MDYGQADSALTLMHTACARVGSGAVPTEEDDTAVAGCHCWRERASPRIGSRVSIVGFHKLGQYRDGPTT